MTETETQHTTRLNSNTLSLRS